MDSENHLGPLPSGSAFKKELCKLKGNLSAEYTLQRVYSLLKPFEVEEHVTKRFGQAVPGPCAELISSFVWKRIFTWNIDTVLEEIYKLSHARQTLCSKNYTDGYVEADNLQELLLVHLHGVVTRPEDGYVFSRNEYVNNMRNISHWMLLLTQIMRSEPMIISGSGFDEIDLEYYLSFRSSLTSRDERGPSIFVDLTDDAVVSDICASHDMLHFVGYSQDFFAYCETLIPNSPTPYDLISSDMKRLIPGGTDKRAALAFQSDFSLVPATAHAQDKESGFFYGQEVDWSDLASNFDISRSSTGPIINRVEQSLKAGSNLDKICLISEMTGTGKTTTILRASFELAKRGYRVLLCSAENVLGRASADIIDTFEEPTVIVVDNFADHVTSVVELLSRVEKKDLVVLAAERTYRQKYIDVRTHSASMYFRTSLALNDTEVSRLVTKYQEFGLVGAQTKSGAKKTSFKNIKSDPIAIACCRILNDFTPLDKIVVGLVTACTSTDLDRYVISALARLSYSGGIRYAVLASAISPAGLKEQLTTSHPLPLGYSDKHNQFVIPQNSTLSEQVLDYLRQNDKPRMLKCFSKLASSISSRVDRQAIIKRSPEARMAGQLFDFDELVSKYIGSDADKFYLRVKEEWKWNSRYWEQVALLKLSEFHRQPNSTKGKTALLSAVQNAKNAVRIERHPFPLTTAGKILLVQAAQSSALSQTIFDEALQFISEAIEVETRWVRPAPQPYISLLQGTSNYLDAHGKLSNQTVFELRKHCAGALTRFSKDREVKTLARMLSQRLDHALL